MRWRERRRLAAAVTCILQEIFHYDFTTHDFVSTQSLYIIIVILVCLLYVVKI